MTSWGISKIIICLILMIPTPLILSLSLICDPDEFYCEQTIKCIDSEYLCDGDNDCGDSSDEEEAACSRGGMQVITFLPMSESLEECADHEIACSEESGSKCIHRNWVCDGEWDCLHGSDEAHCAGQSTTAAQDTSTNPNHIVTLAFDPFIPRHTRPFNPFVKVLTHSTQSPRQICTNLHFRCPNGYCIDKRWACDGERDCIDGSDESSQMCLGKSDSTTRSISTVRSYPTSPITTIHTTRVDSQTNGNIHSSSATVSSNEKSSEDCDTQASTSSISFTLWNWIEFSLLILGIACVIAIAVFVCKKRKSRSVGLSSRNAEDRRQAVSFLNSNMAPECQLVLVGTPVQVQPTVVQSTSTIDQPPPYNAQPSPNPFRIQNPTKGEDY